MELKQRISLERIFKQVYFVALIIYLIIGFLPARATPLVTYTYLEIPSISLSSEVTALQITDSKLPTPDTIVGSFSKNTNKTLLIGHSSTVFSDLGNAKLGDQIYFYDKTYQITKTATKPKTDIDMNELLAPATHDTIILMTCAGDNLAGNDYSHRLIIEAVKV